MLLYKETGKRLVAVSPYFFRPASPNPAKRNDPELEPRSSDIIIWPPTKHREWWTSGGRILFAWSSKRPRLAQIDSGPPARLSAGEMRCPGDRLKGLMCFRCAKK